MLPLRKKRILNEVAEIRTFLILFGRLSSVFEWHRTNLLDGRDLSRLPHAPAAGTSRCADGNAARDDSGRKSRSPPRFLTAEAASEEACARLGPGAGSEGSCEAGFPPFGGMPLRNDELKAPPSWPTPPSRFSGLDGIRCTRRCAVQLPEAVLHGWARAAR